MGVVVSKKFEKSAVKRNLIRRRILAAAKEILAGLAKEPAFDIVILPRKASLKLSHEERIQALKPHFNL